MKLTHSPLPRAAGLVGLTAMSLLAGCIEPNTSPVVAQGEAATLSGATWLLTDPNAMGGKALKLSPRQGVRVAYGPGSLPATSLAVRLRTDGCPVDAYVKYTINFQPSASGAPLAQIGPVRTLASTTTEGAPADASESPWVTVTLSEGLAPSNQLGRFDIRQLPHDNTSLPSTCGLAVDQGALRGTGSPGFANKAGAGKARFFLRTNSETDGWMDLATYNTWNAAHYHRAEVHRTHADQYLPWYSGGLSYFKSHAPNGFAIPNPAWILKAGTTEARVNWSGGGCFYCQPALDIGNPEVRTFLIAKAKEALTGPNGKQYKGLWVDDVNMSLYFKSPAGQDMTPTDPRTGQPMTDANWQRYMAEWMEALRAALPATVEIYHNSKYYTDAWGIPTYTNRQVAAATGIHIEGGFTDYYLGRGDANFSVAALARYLKKIHDLGRAAIVDNYADTDAMRNYSLAAYFMFAGDNDMIANNTGNRPSDWWSGYDTDLGTPTTAAPTAPTPSGLWQRNFTGGMVVMVEPTGLMQEVQLVRAMVDREGTVLPAGKIWVKPRQGFVLTNLPSAGAPTGIQKPVIFSF